MQRSKLPIEVTRLNRGSVPGGEDQAGVNPAISRAIAISVLLLLTDLERSHTQIRQRERRFRGLGLNLPANELVTDTLKLLPHVQLGSVKVDSVPGQAEDFTPAQAEDEDQDVGRVERFTGMRR